MPLSAPLKGTRLSLDATRALPAPKEVFVFLGFF